MNDSKYKYYFEYLKKYKTLCLIALLFLVINTYILYRIPFIASKLVNLLTLSGLENGRDLYQDFMSVVILFILFNLFSTVSEIVSEITFSKLGIKISLDIKEDLVNTICYSKDWNFEIGDTMETFISDSSSIGEQGLIVLYQIIHSVVMMSTIGYFMIKTSLIMTLVVLLIFIFSMFIELVLNKKITTNMDKIRDVGSDLYYISSTIVKDAKEINRNKAILYFISKFKNTIVPFYRLEYDIVKLSTLNTFILSVISLSITIFVYVYGFTQIYSGTLLIGSLFIFSMYAQKLGGQILRIPNLIISLKQFGIAYNRVLKILMISTYNKEINKDFHDVVKDVEKIEFNNIDFKYSSTDDCMQLKNINFTLRKGEISCLKGTNGSGKTTLIKLLSGELKPCNGTIYINGEAFSLYDNKYCLDKQLYHLSAEPLIINDSLITNILPNSDDDSSNEIVNPRIVDYFKDLNLNDWIQEDETIINFKINDDYSNLSSGQKQKICLIRCILYNCNIVILDEPEKNLDLESIKKLIRYLNNIKKDKIILVVSHNKLVQSFCDKTIDLDMLKGDCNNE